MHYYLNLCIWSKDVYLADQSFEIFCNDKKLISNSGYYPDTKNRLNKLSRSTALQNTLSIEDYSSCDFIKSGDNLFIQKGLKVGNKNIVFEKNYWKISASHNGYSKKFKLDHHREIEFYPEQFKFVGHDKIVRKDPDKQIKFDIRFHLHPDSKVMKTQNNKFIHDRF